jgi:hypothetical protein
MLSLDKLKNYATLKILVQAKLSNFLIKKKACNEIGTSLFWKAKKTLAFKVPSVAYEPTVVLK